MFLTLHVCLRVSVDVDAHVCLCNVCVIVNMFSPAGEQAIGQCLS